MKYIVNKMIWNIFFLFIFIWLLLTQAINIYSQTNQGTIFENPIKYNSLGEILINLVDWVVIILIPILALSIVYIGFRMVLVFGSKPEEYIKWKNSLGWSLVGLFIVLGSKGIILVIQNTVDNVLKEPTVNAVNVIEVS